MLYHLRRIYLCSLTPGMEVVKTTASLVLCSSQLVPPELEAAARMAAATCPEEAITITD
jgi:hypothetical protein